MYTVQDGHEIHLTSSEVFVSPIKGIEPVFFSFLCFGTDRNVSWTLMEIGSKVFVPVATRLHPKILFETFLIGQTFILWPWNQSAAIV